MKKIFYYIIVALSVALLPSCEKFLTLTPDYEVPVDNLYKTESDFNIAVIGCYAKLQGQVNYYKELCEYRSDNMYISAPTAGYQDRYDIDQFKDNASNGIVQEAWANFNNGVYRCNLVLDKIDDADIDDTAKKQFKGEALFLRAYTYFNMYRLWGGVPVTTRVLTVAEALKVKRASDQEMFQLISGDLNSILSENLLPSTYNNQNAGRATIGAARALLGKVYLTFKYPKEAANTLEPMINSEYDLLNNIQDVFDVANKNNKEIIFSVKFNKEVVGEGHGAWFGISNLSDESGISPIINNLYDDTDARKALIEYQKVDGVNLYLMRKFYDLRDETTKNYGNDQILIRFSDVLLMYAEALNDVAYSSAPDSQALKALNRVRTRSGLNALKISELPNQDSFKRAICKERQMEFPFEGHRWFDVVRMGYAKEFALAEGHLIQDYQLLFPIPNTELERINDTSLLWQNPNY